MRNVERQLRPIQFRRANALLFDSEQVIKGQVSIFVGDA